MSDEVLISAENGVGRIRLNRPKAIHSLTLGMCDTINAALADWKRDDAVTLLMIDHSEGRGFCAGGDVLALHRSGTSDGKEARAFFHSEYRMNHSLFTYPKPTVAFMDGIVMGGGVGISQPCRYRVATENTKFAMPEGTIGLFPDVGGGWYLSRLPGQIGKYLALSAARADGADCMAVGLATHYIPSEKLEAVKAELIARPSEVEAILDAASTTPPPSALMEQRTEIDRLFAADTLEEIIAALAADGGEWAEKQHGIVLAKSPQTGKVSLRQLREAAAMTDFADEMRQEYAIGSRIVMSHDFAEGVRALLIDKDNAPKWSPATAEGVTESMIDAIFAPLAPDEAWTPAP
ncbi:MAG: enoyl-CoA hydratase/isomerase family protein [Sphingobium sp.]|nr:enoyl-CoA hydratase/isomerase family protein [Sphingobium sp.]MCP5398078.1 enoyl-CoA hydratase/isomerase family protein [Sphingomonas sp.]